MILKANHTFNLLDARGDLVTERAAHRPRAQSGARGGRSVLEQSTPRLFEIASSRPQRGGGAAPLELARSAQLELISTAICLPSTLTARPTSGSRPPENLVTRRPRLREEARRRRRPAARRLGVDVPGRAIAGCWSGRDFVTGLQFKSMEREPAASRDLSGARS
jgi:hypothetical protein